MGNEDEVVDRAREELSSCYIQLLNMFKNTSLVTIWLCAYVWNQDERS